MAGIEGPYLSAALLCEKVLEEKDGVKSAIRMVDRVIRTAVGPSPPQVMEPFEYELTLLVRLKSGSVRGVYQLKITLAEPSGESRSQAVPVVFEGEEDKGLDVVAPLRLRIPVPGIYWIEIYLENDFLTKVPMRVVYIPQTIALPQIPEKGEG